MKRAVLGFLTGGFLLAAMAAGCGSSDVGDNSGGASSTGSKMSTSSSSSSSKASSSSSSKASSSNSSSTGAGAGGSSNCTELTPSMFQRTQYDAPDPNGQFPPGDANFIYNAGVKLGDPTVDDLSTMQFYGSMSSDITMLTGVQDLTSSDNSNYATCSTCVVVYQDNDPNNGPAKTFFQTSGKIDLGTSTMPAASGTMTDVTLVEVTIDSMTYESTPVPGGACLHIASANFKFDPAPAGWTCDPGQYGDKAQCDCTDCGTPDEDCSDTTLPINGCAAGQTCGADGMTCMGTPTGWTCDGAAYNDGTTCDCGCGIADPDCSIMGAPVNGCMMGESCNDNALCVPAGWTCDPDAYGDGFYCDCKMCGADDPDCSDPNVTFGDCQDGQTCTNQVCTGVPTAWTCDPTKYDDGTACDCGCGAGDPDCANSALPVNGCNTGEICGSDTGTCLPAGWTCDPAYYGDGTYCDCGCGVVDTDCADATSASCDPIGCNDMGSCDENGSDCSTINATNNAVCM